ncbi:MAG: nucleoside triphosphate pyrophosphohydrolase [Kiritimatiellia bacterium]|nr:nucleoside triphosphate pyrophosphohydrolase [Kiritimatiellia bacterium]
MSKDGSQSLSNEEPKRPIDRLLWIMRRLRSETGCPWDRKQSLDSLKKYLIEECYETLDAIDSGNRSKLREELGDVLLQIVFQSQICSEEGAFHFDDVAAEISEKLVRRHPHVFGTVEVAGADEVLRNWDAIKREERADRPGSVVDGVPRHLPALLKADQVQTRAARAGFDWKDMAPVFAKLDEEIGELREAIEAGEPAAIREELGDVLFTVVNLSRFLSCNAEEALQFTTDKFIRRFREVEKKALEKDRRLSDCSLAELDALWDAVKIAESHDGGLPAAHRKESGE